MSNLKELTYGRTDPIYRKAWILKIESYIFNLKSIYKKWIFIYVKSKIYHVV